ncbi:MAG: NAD(P)/FAD-dependent oxidoreductase [Acidobacteria bacterium]|nr:MAG: NAD(P)/FAD-dependent oxidoreductase [Acidobacteriota bacterium]
MFDYHVVVLGGGLAYTGVELLRRAGLKVAIVERESGHLGGVCLHEGCIPTKLYLFEVRKLFDLNNSPLIECKPKLNLRALKEKKDKLTKRLRDDIERLLKGVDFIYGYGELVEPNVVQVEGKRISGKYIIINTGKSYPQKPNGDDLLQLQELPQKLILVGDDPIALEFATLFALLGTPVELCFDFKVLGFVNPSIRERLLKVLKGLGISLLDLRDFKGGDAYFLYRRKPNSQCINVELSLDEKGHILVDKNYETSVKDHYAVGDVNGLSETAQAARLQALSVARRITQGKGFYLSPHKVPYVLYTQPLSYAKVGFTKIELEEKGIEHSERSLPLRPFAVGSMYHTEEGMLFLYFDKKGFFLGGEVFCRDAQEVLSGLVLSLHGELTLEFMSRAPLPHPTLSELPFLRL